MLFFLEHARQSQTSDAAIQACLPHPIFSTPDASTFAAASSRLPQVDSLNSSSPLSDSIFPQSRACSSHGPKVTDRTQVSVESLYTVVLRT